MHDRLGPVHGWGFTLKNEMDIAVDKFLPSINRSQYTIDYGVDGTGNINRWANIEHLSQLVKTATDGQGADLVLADGGMDTHDAADQETLLKQLMLNQTAAAFSTVRD